MAARRQVKGEYRSADVIEQRRAVARGIVLAVVIQIKAPACACGIISLCGKISPARPLIGTWNWPS
jgi:uncharacterized membrane protein